MTDPGARESDNAAQMEDVRPQVGRDSGNRPLWLGFAAILVLGMLLFFVLDARRQAGLAPAVKPRAADLAIAPREMAPLYVPPEPILAAPMPAAAPTPMPTPAAPSPAEPPPATQPPIMPMPSPPVIIAPQPMPGPPPGDAGPVIVHDISGPAAEAGGTPSAGAGAPAPAVAVATRARAGRLANRGTIIPQGTLIATVLETALDSTQPGQARALVSTDVTNVLSGKVLIPRGSRLFGDYKGEIQPGQKRATIIWTRLVRPDGVTVALESPASDRLGRAGVRGRVNSHFFERLSGALLQSSIDIGKILAARAIYDGSGVFVSAGNSLEGATSQLVGPAPKPTLTIRQGTSIAVLVARDLDFTGVEAVR